MSLVMLTFCRTDTVATDVASALTEHSGATRGMLVSAAVAHDIAMSVIGLRVSRLDVATIWFWRENKTGRPVQATVKRIDQHNAAHLAIGLTWHVGSLLVIPEPT
jgi:hypothetical protein